MKCFQDTPRGNAEAGFTLIELLMVMVISLIIGAAALMAIQTGQTSSAKTTARQEATTETEHALARITREVRQATQVAITSASQLDLKTWVRPAAGGAATVRHVRYQCTNGTPSQGGTCTRTICTSVPSLLLNSTCSGTPDVFLRGIDEFAFGAQLGGLPTSPTVNPPSEARQSSIAFDVVTLRARVRLNDRTSGRESVKDLDPIELQGGVRLESLRT